MAVIQGHFYSSCLKMESHFQAFLPFDKKSSHPASYLILLHGMMDNCFAWMENTRLCSYAETYNTLVFLPEGHRSYYSDFRSGGAYQAYITTEVPSVMEKMFGITMDRDNTTIAGNSMGGYGAIKAAFTRPELFGRCAALSPVIHPIKALDCIPGSYLIPGEERAIWGDPASLPDASDLCFLASRSKSEGLYPGLCITCGRDDFLVQQNREFQNRLKALEIPCLYREYPGEHGWDYWNAHLNALFQDDF